MAMCDLILSQRAKIEVRVNLVKRTLDGIQIPEVNLYRLPSSSLQSTGGPEIRGLDSNNKDRLERPCYHQITQGLMYRLNYPLFLYILKALGDDNYWNQVYRFQLKRIKDEYEAEEVTVQTFSKAFDSISFNFILTALELFKFSDQMKGWVSILLHKFQSQTMINGNASQRITLGRGCRQGDPISGYLFILAIEILLLRLA